jgi:serine/threonine protein kinase
MTDTDVDSADLQPYPMGNLLESTTSSHSYELGDKIGEGGFGTVYAARGLDAKSSTWGPLCIKILLDPHSWHGEAFYGELLKDNSRAIRLHEAFSYPVMAGGKNTHFYILVSELAAGDLQSHLSRRSRPWPEKRALKEVLALLGLLEQLHSVGIFHRDITPKNILVTPGGCLKLSDFGITRMALKARGPDADLRNPLWAPPGHIRCKIKHWTTQDDVYQMGNILAALLSGHAERPLKPSEKRRLDCSERTKQVILTATGPGGRIYPDVGRMKQELTGDVSAPVRTLAGKKVVITGVFSVTRAEMERRVQQAGGKCQGKVNSLTDVIVTGKISPSYPAHRRVGGKLRAVDALRRNGRVIPSIGEMEFMALTRRQPRNR